MAEDLIGPPAVEDDETSNSNHSDPEQELLQPNEAGTSWEPFAFPFMDEDDSSEDGIFVSDSDTDTDFENESNSLCEECLHRANNNGDAMDSGSSNDNDNAENLNPEFSIEVDEGIEDADNIIENLNENSILNFTQALSVRVRKPLDFMLCTSD